MLPKERWYGPGEMAKKLGVSVKALRVYEREGLVAPLRAESGWRAYGPAQVEQLHRIIALRDLGLTLKQIQRLLSGGQAGFDAVLTLQQEALEAQRARIDRGITLIKAARHKLDKGEALTVDDLIHLTQETTMQTSIAMQAVKTRLKSLLQARGLDDDGDALRTQFEQTLAAAGTTKEGLFDFYKPLMAEAKRLMEVGDESSEDAKALYRRWRANAPDLKRPVDPAPEKIQALKAAFSEVMSDPDVAKTLPFDAAVFPFIARIGKGMRDRGELA